MNSVQQEIISPNPNNYNMGQMQPRFMDKKERRKRRTKKESANARNFICGCGKAYLSYPALYTHVKQKHDGFGPPGTTEILKKKCGRPRKNFCSQPVTSYYQKPKDPRKDFDEGFLNYLNQITIQRQTDKGIECIQVTRGKSDIPYNPIDSFPQQAFKFKDDFTLVLAYIEQIKEYQRDNNQRVFPEEYDEEKALKSTKLNMIFSIFLEKLSQIVQPFFYQEFCVLICLYRRCLNQIGWSKLEERGIAVTQDLKKQQFCEVNNGEYAPEICNEFASELLSNYLADVHLDTFLFIGETEDKMKNSIYFIMHFCNWLYHQMYTNERLTINMDEFCKAQQQL